jgi:hypothetical protein
VGLFLRFHPSSALLIASAKLAFRDDRQDENRGFIRVIWLRLVFFASTIAGGTDFPSSRLMGLFLRISRAPKHGKFARNRDP